MSAGATLPARQSAGPAAFTRDALLLFVGVAVLAWIAIRLAREPGAIATLWFANAFAIGILATTAAPRWPGLVLAVAAGNLAANTAVGDGFGLSVSFALSNATEVLLGAALVRSWVDRRSLLDGPVALLRTATIGSLTPALVGATLGAAVLHLQGLGSFGTIWLDWYVGSAVGAVVVLPLVVAWRSLGAAAGGRELATPKVVALALLTLGITLLALGYLPYPFVYSAVPLTVAAFIAPPIAIFALCLMTLLATAVTLGTGQFAPVAEATHWRELLVYTTALLALLPSQLLVVALWRERDLARTLAALTSDTTDLLLFFDLDGKVRAVNRAWGKYWQRDPQSAIGLHPVDLVPADQRSDGMAARVASALGGTPVSARVEQNFPTLGRRTLDVSYQPAFDADGRRIGVVFTAHDVSDLLRIQAELENSVAELRRANEGLEQFARIASHDLREPLNTIVQFTGLIEDDHGSELTPAARRYFEQVKSGAQRLRVMLDDLLQYVRLERLGYLTLAPIDLNEPVAQALAALHARIDGRRAQVTVEVLPQAAGQSSLLSLLFQNLVSNALKFVPPDRAPQVRISARGDGEHVIVSVEDNGIGIDAKDIGTLFEPFRRLHARRKFDGTGLGLAICRRIVVALGGTIELHSPPGQGTRVEVRLKRG